MPFFIPQRVAGEARVKTSCHGRPVNGGVRAGAEHEAFTAESPCRGRAGLQQSITCSISVRKEEMQPRLRGKYVMTSQRLWAGLVASGMLAVIGWVVTDAVVGQVVIGGKVGVVAQPI